MLMPLITELPENLSDATLDLENGPTVNGDEVDSDAVSSSSSSEEMLLLESQAKITGQPTRHI